MQRNTFITLATQEPLLHGLPQVGIPNEIKSALITLSGGLQRLLGGAFHSEADVALKVPDRVDEKHYVLVWMCGKSEVPVFQLESLFVLVPEFKVQDWSVKGRRLELAFGLASSPQKQEQKLCTRLSSRKQWNGQQDPLRLLRDLRTAEHDKAFRELATPNVNRACDTMDRTVTSHGREVTGHYMAYLAPCMYRSCGKDYKVQVGRGKNHGVALYIGPFTEFRVGELATMLKPLIWIDPVLALDDMTLRLDLKHI